MDDIDDVIGLLNYSNRQKEKVKAQESLNQATMLSQATIEEQKEIADRKLNIEKLMEELETMKAKKQELLEINIRLKENQERPQRDYSNEVKRSAAL